jgi:hypothetical protein
MEHAYYVHFEFSKASQFYFLLYILVPRWIEVVAMS